MSDTQTATVPQDVVDRIIAVRNRAIQQRNDLADALRAVVAATRPSADCLDLAAAITAATDLLKRVPPAAALDEEATA